MQQQNLDPILENLILQEEAKYQNEIKSIQEQLNNQWTSTQLMILKNKINLSIQNIESQLQADRQHQQSLTIKSFKHLRQRVNQKLNQVLNQTYNAQTQQILKGILTTNSKQNLYDYKVQLLQILTNKKPSEDVNVRKINRLIEKVESKIQEIQEKFKDPYFFQKSTKKYLEDFIRLINFFLMSSWLIIFFLAKKDDSEGIDIVINGTQTTFRDYLWSNGYITLALAVIFCSFNISLTKLWAEGTALNSNNKIHVEKDGKFQIQKNRNILSTVWIMYEVVMTISVLLIMLVKIVWIIFGIYLFLSGIEFSRCSTFLIGYCFVEFMVYFTYGAYCVINWIFRFMSQKWQNKLREKILKDYMIQKQRKETTVQTSYEQNLKLREKTSLIYVNFNDFQYLLSKLLTWTLVSWISQFVFYFKEKSMALNEVIYSGLTFRSWIKIDATLAGIIFTTVLILTVILIVKNATLLVWRQEAKGLFYVEWGFFSKHWYFVAILLVIVFAKICSILSGIAFFYMDLDFSKISGCFALFFITYFTQSIFLLIEGFSIFINGGRAKTKLLNQRLIEKDKTE